VLPAKVVNISCTATFSLNLLFNNRITETKFGNLDKSATESQKKEAIENM
jgi:hypothetical protein